MTTPSKVIELASADLPPPHARPYCKQCTHEHGYLARYIKTNGRVCIRWVCAWCEGYTTSQDLPATVLPRGTTVDELPLRIDQRPDDGPLCVVCDSRDVEYHHWAPTSIFPEWAHVPGIYLCPPHHTEWHDRLRLHGLRWPHELTEST